LAQVELEGSKGLQRDVQKKGDPPLEGHNIRDSHPVHKIGEAQGIIFGVLGGLPEARVDKKKLIT